MVPAMELEELMMGMVELPVLYNALFPTCNTPNIRLASEPAIKASESFNKRELLSAHEADIAKFTSWLSYVDIISATKEKERKENVKEKFNDGSSNGKGLLLKLRESVVEIPPRPPAPMGILRPIKLSDLHLDRQHYGRVLYGTFCAKAFKMTAVLTLLEDPKSGHVIKIAIYNAVPSTATPAEVQTQFPEGSRVAIKEPYFKRYKDNTVGLRVNNPGDVVFIESMLNAPSTKGKLPGSADREIERRQLNLSYDELRLEGNRAFSAGNWQGAAQFYTSSISLALNSTNSWALDNSYCEPPKYSKKLPSCSVTTGTSKKNAIVIPALLKKSAKKINKQRNRNICEQKQAKTQSKAELKADLKAESALLAAYSNRSEVWLRLCKHEEALVDAENALQIDSAHVKSMFRRGRALHGLQQYSKAVQCFQSALLLSPRDSDLEKALKESLTGDLQSRLGVYDLSSYYLGNFSGPPPSCADYVGPVVVQMLEAKYGKGSGQRGLVVNKSVKAGDLLLVSNPLALARVEGENIEFHLIPATRRMNDASQEDLVTQLYNFVRTSPRALDQLYSLHNGSRESTEPSMDLFVPGTSNAKLAKIKSRSCIAAQPDITKIRQIVQWNAFDEHGYATKGGRRGLRGFCSGIWVLPSFINHSCLPNASRVHVGDAMLIYAARDLKVGDEVCLPYFDILSPLLQRRDKSTRGWGFICKCSRCMLEEGQQSEIKHITDRFSRLEEDALPAIQEATAASRVTKMSSSYLGYDFFRHAAKFLSLARDLETILSIDKFEHLTSREKNWVRASYASAYIVGHSGNSRVPSIQKADTESGTQFLNKVLDSLGEVFPGNSQTLISATTLMDELGKQKGVKSQAFRDAEETVMYFCRCMFGNQKVPVLRSLIKALQEGFMDV